MSCPQTKLPATKHRLASDHALNKERCQHWTQHRERQAREMTKSPSGPRQPGDRERRAEADRDEPAELGEERASVSHLAWPPRARSAYVRAFLMRRVRQRC